MFVLVLLNFNLKQPEFSYPWQKPLIFSIFVSICFLGIMAGLFPSKCLKIIHSQKKVNSNISPTSNQEISKKFMGHHPDCGNFSEHVLSFRNSKYCAGCTGLVAGATIAIIGSLFYITNPLNFNLNSGIILWIGIAGVTLTLFQHTFIDIDVSCVKLISNVIFVLGSFFVLLGIDMINGGLFIELYFLTLALMWIYTRILISEKNHQRICADCDIKSCEFLENPF